MTDITLSQREERERRDREAIGASKAPLMEHLIELRTRLIYSMLAFVGMFLICFFLAKPIYNLLVWPYCRVVGDGSCKLIATHFLEQLFTHIKLAMFGAAFLSFPIIATQIYKFVAPGLYSNERGAFLPYLIATPCFFLLGASVVYFVAMPLLIQFSIGLTQHVEGQPVIELLPKVSEYLSLIMTLIFGFGLMFQLPAILTLLARTGFVTADALSGGRRYAIVAIAAAAAVLSPPDPFSMIAMMAPTVLLYEASIFVVDRIAKAQAAKANQTT